MSSPLAVLRRLQPPADAGTLAAYARTRDPQLLAELVRRHGGLVWGVCRRAVPHRPDAEDAYQATWLVLAANPAAVRTPAALPAFLHAVAVRVCRRVRGKRPLVASGDHLPGREPPAADALSAREYLAALDDELAKLPDKLRQPLVLCFLDGRTQDEAAAALGLSLSTLKRRLDAGKELLRVRLEGRGVDLAAVLAAAGLMGGGPPAVTAGGAGVVATVISTEVLSAMWMLKAKAWAAGLVLAAGLAATGGGLLVADDQARPGAGLGRIEVPGVRPGVRPVGAAANFVIDAPTPELADKLLAAAETARRELAVRWLGRELPPWPVACRITYKPSIGTDAGGATHFSFGPDGVQSQRMELFGELNKTVADTLPHEVMHTVLAAELRAAAPRWADEGIAVLAQSPASQHAHAVRVAELLNQGRAIPLRALLPMAEYPKDMQVLFAQGYSVCRFLVDRVPAGGEAKLVEFVRRGKADGWEPAAKAVYGFADLDAMQAEWIASLMVPVPPPAVPPPPADPVRTAHEAVARELEKAIAAADEATTAQRKAEEQYRNLPGVSVAERLNNVALVARYRENAAQNRVELAKVRVEIAKLGAAPPVAAAVPPRLLRERIDTARRILVLDREIRGVGAIPKEEAAAFVANMTATARLLYEAVRAADATPAGVLAAAREWYITARDGEAYYQATAARGLTRTQTALAATLARTEAEAALSQASATAPPAARDGIDPFAAPPPGYAGRVTGGEHGRATVKPSDGLKVMTALRVSRGGKPVGVLVVTAVEQDTASGVPLPNPDGTVPALQPGDDVRP